MAYEKPEFCRTGTHCVAFDADFIAEICKMAEELLKIRCGVDAWSLGTERKIVTGSDDQFYLSNPEGDPASNNPVGGDGSHWLGPFCSVAEITEYLFMNAGSSTTPTCDDNELTLPVSQSLISNADFDSYTDMSTLTLGIYVPDDWFQLSDGTVDYLLDSRPGIGADRFQPSPDGELHAGFIFNSQPGNAGNLYYEYLAQVLNTPLTAGTTYFLSAYAGGGTVLPDLPPYPSTTGNRQFVLYGMPAAVGQVSGSGAIASLGVGAVELGRATLTVTETDWETLTFEFTPTTDIQTIAIGGVSTDATADFDVNRKYMFVDRILLAEKSQFSCP